MPQVSPSRKRLRASSSDLSLRHEAHSASASDARAALSARCAVDAVPFFWRELASKAGAASADVFICRIGYTVAAALRNVSESAEESRSQLRSQRAALLAAVDARYDTLEQGITVAASSKTVALERELCTIDGVLEAWRAGCSGMRETITRLDDAELVDQQVVLNARLDDLESQLQALPTEPVEPPVVGIAADLSHLMQAISGFGRMLAPRTITAADLTLAEYPAYAVWGTPIVLRLILGADHTDQSPEELNISVGLVASILRIDAIVSMDDAPAFDLDAVISFNSIKCSIDITIPVPARPAAVAGVLRLNCVELSGISLMCTHDLIPIACAFTAEELAAVDASNPSAVCAAMLADAPIVGVAEWGCGLLAKNYKVCEADQYALIVSTLVVVLRTHCKSQSVASTACKALAELAFDFPVVSVIAVDAGMAAVIVLAMKMNSAFKDVVQPGCVALCNITANSVVRSQQAAVDAGAAAALVAMIEAHMGDAHLSDLGCRVLGNMAFHFAVGQQALVDAGAPAAIVVAMQSHTDDDRLSGTGCYALGNIACKCSSGQQAAVNAGAPAVIVAAMQTHTESNRVSEEGSCALNHICSEFVAGQQATVDSGAPAAIIAAMREHAGDAHASEMGCAALARIACNFAAGQQATVDAGAPAAIVAAMQAHIQDDNVYEEGCIALSYMSKESISGQQAAVDAGALVTVVAGMHVHGGVLQSFIIACATLDAISRNFVAGQQAALDAGAPGAVVAGMQVHAAGNADMTSFGYRTLSALDSEGVLEGS